MLGALCLVLGLGALVLGKRGVDLILVVVVAEESRVYLGQGLRFAGGLQDSIVHLAVQAETLRQKRVEEGRSCAR